MKSAVFILALVVAVGCGKSTPTVATKPPPVDEASAEAVPAPGSTEATRVGLIRNGEIVRVGADPHDVLKRLKGDVQGGFTSTALPGEFEPPFESLVWQVGDSGYGIISYKGKVVMAMIQDSNASASHLQQMRDGLQELVGTENPPEVIEGKKETFWFWQDTYTAEGKSAGQTMMLMAFQQQNGNIFLTAAMGDDLVLGALGISYAQAQKDQIEADSILDKFEETRTRTNRTRP